MTVQWGKRYRPRKSDNGHTPLQFGRGERKGYVRCQCGVTLSSRSDAIASWRRHYQRKVSAS
jgi:hypothetical protein